MTRSAVREEEACAGVRAVGPIRPSLRLAQEERTVRRRTLRAVPDDISSSSCPKTAALGSGSRGRFGSRSGGRGAAIAGGSAASAARSGAARGRGASAAGSRTARAARSGTARGRAASVALRLAALRALGAAALAGFGVAGESKGHSRQGRHRKQFPHHVVTPESDSAIVSSLPALVRASLSPTPVCHRSAGWRTVSGQWHRKNGLINDDIRADSQANGGNFARNVRTENL